MAAFGTPSILSSAASFRGRARDGRRVGRAGQDSGGHVWRKIPCMGDVPGPRSGAASVVVGDKIYMFGGYGGGGRLEDFYEYNLESKMFKRVYPNGPTTPGKRENNGVVLYNNCLYIFGGYNGKTWLNDFHEYSLELNRWRAIEATGKKPDSRFGYVSVVHRDSFILFGGYDGSSWLNDMWSFDFANHRWKELHPSGDVPSERSCPSWCKHEDSVFVFGGYDGSRRMNDFFEYDCLAQQWTEIEGTGTMPSPRYFHSCAIYQNNLYVFGGYNGTERLCDMHQYNFETNAWTPVKCKGSPPTGRSSLVLQVAGNTMLIFGGYNGRRVLNDFYEFKFQSVIIPPPRLIADLRTLYERGDEFGDVEFVVGGKSIFAVAALLAIRSDHFRALLFGGMRESLSRGRGKGKVFYHQDSSEEDESLARSDIGDIETQGESGSSTKRRSGRLKSKESKRSKDKGKGKVKQDDKDADGGGGEIEGVMSENSSTLGSEIRRIKIEDVSYETFTLILEYLYTDQVQCIPEDQAVPLLIASGRYLLDRLKGICEETIRTSITRENVASILVAAHRHEAVGLKEICLDYIVERMETVKETLLALKQEPEILYEIIMKQSERQAVESAIQESRKGKSKKSSKQKRRKSRSRSRSRRRRNARRPEEEEEDDDGDDNDNEDGSDGGAEDEEDDDDMST